MGRTRAGSCPTDGGPSHLSSATAPPKDKAFATLLEVNNPCLTLLAATLACIGWLSGIPILFGPFRQFPGKFPILFDPAKARCVVADQRARSS